MPASPVEDHHGMVTLRDCRGEAVQKHLHGCRIGIGHHQREAIVRARLHGSEDIGEGEAPVAKAWRALAALPPNVAGTAFLADPRLVLEEQANALVFMTYTDGLQQRWGSF
jgi:hypothetical protein